ncbi:ABC-2 family transporter protein [Flavobacterium sp. Fl-77]|uniref:ABC-2 family transporter protein n=1 Tax=Flavobacterium flavipigmentatum TaxID=2893884 RepID=A0AAJ2VVN2_9FLAO|nr:MULTISPECIES: ABC-2 family transporter protein [unclassified Flavobacterium]MDX6180673.1 ABC-2 family transporter protein [Flavobacterium sp. Fl-33]MDX6184273.1 ABC-2 family transporter protein [Flavobacterium sp. Fl-77]UFH39385.1 ABC-2 family transporter protein [Flavobacterium sp. F-70]
MMKLYFKVLILEAKTKMTYRFDFWINSIISFLVEFFVVWFLWSAIFEQTKLKQIAGYNLSSIYLYYLGVILISKIIRAQKSTNDVSQDIYQGNLNRYIIFPVNYISFKYAQYLGKLAPALIQFFLFGIIAFFIIDKSYEIQISTSSLIMGICSIAMANILYFLIDYLTQLFAFWVSNVWSLDILKWFIACLLGGYLFPLNMLPPNVQNIITYLPFKFLFDLPINTLFGKISFEVWLKEMLIGSIWCILLFLIGQFTWSKGKNLYSGVGI